ncbi:LOW QUALITY PROTEIN: U3 small nucleolar RNA-associated protein 14 homolog B [Leguminivora glycinivorella]|uniref:LOW QUALITY PROTEIN: U3 small nucleolar RNA-associated protein 14 homolog B n=1 Tax=Leguminivora glycinivorella TaxID=1035111 RepID=UPI00200E9E54|nr:LOW QUALITY PROTEIN: U3 small nucleolar RNA-associated protein 14 homolog B [Leguminivora glycinivorella]
MEDIEESDFVASEHDKLVHAISKLDKTQFITEPTRSEPTNLNSEFNLIKTKPKLDLTNVVKVLEDTSHHVQISKKLKKSQDNKQVLTKPLEKPQAERIKRATGYEQTKEKVGRWDPVVARARTVDFVSFPLKGVSTKMQPTHEFLAKFELKSNLEKELEEIDPPNIQVEDDEEEKVYPMTYEEMLEHRQHSAKLRAQQSYKAAKAKRQGKIKSKKYHRILKKERLKLQLKEFEELQKKDPEEALKKLEALEKARALERHTLRHKNTGKWAKSKLVRAKYDKETRQELAEQLAVSRGLTQKTQANDSSDEENDDSENIPDITLSQDPMNPWMMKRSDKSEVDAEFDFGYKKYVQGKTNKKDDSDSDDDETQHPGGDKDSKALDMLLLGNSINRIGQEDGDDPDEETQIQTEMKKTQNPTAKNIGKNKPQLPNKLKSTTQNDEVETKGKFKKAKPVKRKNEVNNVISSKKTKTAVATSNWSVEPVNVVPEKKTKKAKADVSEAFEVLEKNIANKVASKINKLKKDIKNLERATKESKKVENKQEERDNLEYLKLKKQKVKAVIDEELIETASKAPEDVQGSNKPISDIVKTAQSDLPVQENVDANIDPTRFIQAKPKYLNSVVPEGEAGHDLLDDDDEQVVPKVNIEEVFEEDDVVDSFRQEKEDEINKDKIEDIDLSLPGWGSWGGKGVKAPKKRRNRFISKPVPKFPRRDENKGDIIIKEFKDPKLAVHKVTNVPFPFKSVKDYEASIRAPIGNTFVTEKAHKKLIKPSVITKAGAIIEAMDEDELLQKRNRNFRNEKVMKLLGQK